MKCERCDNEATVTEVIRQHGQKVTRHLCESCAVLEGLVPPSQSLSDVLGKLTSKPEPAAAPKPEPPRPKPGGATCPTCALSFADFRQSGQLGCPACYKAFENQLAPMIERAHEGATHHVGKVPKRLLSQAQAASPAGAAEAPSGVEALLGDSEDRAQRGRALRRQLDDAVRAEQYERAAKIRDELRRMGETAS